ncbi:hypothetical protein EU546_02540 [Candidatus Thorarchaeota archaeon]|nr:MAG: hypothetical protein EU546_02540 [Candidatus Thorarchaeota archaeon]
MSRMFNEFFSQKRVDVREQRATIKSILEKAPSNVTKISEETKYPKELVVWNLMGMLKWGDIEVIAEEDGELTYGIKEV